MNRSKRKKNQAIRLVITYSIMTLAVIVTVTVLMLSVGNYWFNQETGTLEQRGLVQFGSVPGGATVEIGDKTINSKTPTKYSVEPGSHRFVMWREGYQSWIKTVNVRAGNVVWLNYARLVPKDLPVERLASYETVVASLPSPNQETLLIQQDAAVPSFRLVDIRDDRPRAAVIDIPAAVYETSTTVNEAGQEALAPHVFTIERWDESSRYVLVRDVSGDRNDLIVLDTKEPGRSVNVTREFSIPIESARFSGRSGNVLYVVSEGSLRKIDIAGGTISRSLVANVANFELSEDNHVAYVTKFVDGERTAGVYREGDSMATVLHRTTDEALPVSIAVGTYYRTVYTAISEGMTLKMYKGHHDDGMQGLTLLGAHTLRAPVEKLTFNTANSHVVALGGATYASYGIEQDVFSENVLESGASLAMTPLDNMNVALIADGTLTMRELDGNNIYTIMPAADRQAVTLSRNGTYLYSIGSNDDGTFSLQRVRMILK